MRVDSSRKKSIIAWVAMLTIGVLWGATFPLSNIAVSTGHKPYGLIFWQLVTSAVILGFVLLIKRKKPALNRNLVVFYTIIALIGTLIPNSFSYLVFAQLPAGIIAIAIATVPIFALLIALFCRLERPSILRISGILIGFVAMVIIAAPETSLPEPEKAIFVLVALIAPLCYGMEAVFISLKSPRGSDAISTLFVASCIGLLIVTPVVFISGQWIDLTNEFGKPEVALFISSFIHATVYVGYIWLVGFSGSVFSAQTAYPVTISGVFLSIIFLEEGYSGWIWAALVLVIVGLALVQPKDQEVEKINV